MTRVLNVTIPKVNRRLSKDTIGQHFTDSLETEHPHQHDADRENGDQTIEVKVARSDQIDIDKDQPIVHSQVRRLRRTHLGLSSNVDIVSLSTESRSLKLWVPRILSFASPIIGIVPLASPFGGTSHIFY